MFNIEHVVRPTDRKLTVQLNSIRPDVEIRYTTDDSEPKNNSTLYKEVFTAQPEKTIRACTFLNGVRVGAILPLHIISHKAIGATVISKQTNAYVLTNGIRGTEKITDGEWLDLYDTDGEFTIDLGDTTMCSSIQLGMLNNAGMGIHFPAKITINASIDGKTYFLIYQKDYSLLERFQNGLFKSTEKYTFATCNIRYLRFQVQNPGICPPTLVREGQKTRMAFDEALVN